ncbi:MAG: carbohydrate binding family 9 domain-containing protein, partial [Dysgonamonadaceae bacterium]|nr:carbohydrate binding family 9 domain-containing protein [Dysgonamonadaceae bacterium]
NPPVIDGILNDDCWENTGEWLGTFTQQEPNEGQPETEKTYVKILYDNHNIYVAIRAFDSEPDKIVRRLAPRDQALGDVVEIMFDSYADKRTAFAFGLTAGGTRYDYIVDNFVHLDFTWNPVWEGKVSHDDRGWFAEFRIPLSQLRYSDRNTEQEWGVQAFRFIARKNEASFLRPIPLLNKGFVFSFGTLTGISNLPKSRRIEISPYTSVQYSKSEKEPGNPYVTGTNHYFGAGVDGKIGLSSDFTLDFTINPDFGQVEADPSTINLTAFETYYEEKRPFFIEGKNIFNIAGNFGETMFYSRRIGSSPSWQPGEEYGQYSFVPQRTKIISAIKVSGKNRNGLSLGVFNSITAKEYAKIMQDEHEYKMTAQPLTSYSVARVQQDINKGNTIIGGMLTSTNRSLRDDHLSFLSRNAYTGAVDFAQYFKNREYYTKGNLQYSHVTGSKDAMIAMQPSPVHNFQREGAHHLSIDSSRTALRGTSGTFILGRGGENKLQTEHRFIWFSPGFNLNDLGYLHSTDYKILWGWFNYMDNTPKGIIRKYNVIPYYRFQWDYSNTNIFSISGFEGETHFTNNMGFHWEIFSIFKDTESGMLRGGPIVRTNNISGTNLCFWTDNSKKVFAKFFYGMSTGNERHSHSGWAEVNYRPISNLGLMSRFDYSYRKVGLEYVGQQTLESGDNVYLMGAIRQDIAGLTFRVDYSITPDLSLQFYGSPFISSGKYNEFKRATHTMDKKYENRFVLLNDALTSNPANNRYSVAESDNYQYSFVNPDFSFREFRFNLVMRWEYRPNSTLYLVWAQGRSGTSSQYVSSFNQNTKELFEYFPTNVFMLKLNYWFSL